MKCIKNKCSQYFESDDYYRSCKLTKGYISDECTGYCEIRNKMQEIACEVSRLMVKYNELLELENEIISRQLN